ncbi:lipocalin family protein [Asticcacaulis sp.]|uniref:lipocalin family protein n=1 Tax=Asticcacaulis sp. TaxID=1872648 RepID=UPI003F7B3E19
MKISKSTLAGLLIIGGGAIAGAAILASRPRTTRRPNVPEPAKPVDLHKYAGLWYEVGRYDNPFEAEYEGVTDHYTVTDAGEIDIVATLHKDVADGPERTIPSRAKIVPGTGNSKWKVSFFGPFFLGDYWIMDRADDYSWSIVSEPKGKLLWVMARDPHPALEIWARLQERVGQLGFNWAKVKKVSQPVEEDI